jgi:hypothetical protein
MTSNNRASQKVPSRKVRRFFSISLGFFVLVMILVAVSGGQKTPKANSSSAVQKKPDSPSDTEALAWIKEHRVEAEEVQSIVQSVQAAVGKAMKEGSAGNLDEVATVAQEAHNKVNELREGFNAADDSNEVDASASVEVMEGANELKNSMGALVEYTGNPNPATLAHFTTQYNSGKEKWNEGVSTLWERAPTDTTEGTANFHGSKPPTI